VQNISDQNVQDKYTELKLEVIRKLLETLAPNSVSIDMQFIAPLLPATAPLDWMKDVQVTQIHKFLRLYWLFYGLPFKPHISVINFCFLFVALILDINQRCSPFFLCFRGIWTSFVVLWLIETTTDDD